MGNYHQLYYHATWATKERLPLIDSMLREQLHQYLRGKIIAMGGLALAVGGVSEHIHVCLMIPPHISVATFIGRLKGASAHWINHIKKPGFDFGWQDGYGAFTLNKETIDKVVAYIKNQERHYREVTIERDWELE